MHTRRKIKLEIINMIIDEKTTRTSILHWQVCHITYIRGDKSQSFLITCQPTPRLRMEGGNGVALAYLATAMKAPVDCSNHWTDTRNEKTPRNQIVLT